MDGEFLYCEGNNLFSLIYKLIEVWTSFLELDNSKFHLEEYLRMNSLNECALFDIKIYIKTWTYRYQYHNRNQAVCRSFSPLWCAQTRKLAFSPFPDDHGLLWIVFHLMAPSIQALSAQKKSHVSCCPQSCPRKVLYPSALGLYSFW